MSRPPFMRLARNLGFRAVLGVLCLAGALCASVAVDAKGSLTRVESEFEKAIRRVTPATVILIPHGIDPKKVPSTSSGVVVSRKGLVLSDGDAGYYVDTAKGEKRKPTDARHTDVVDIRIADPRGKGFKAYKARLIHRDRDLDTSLFRMEKPPNGLKALSAGDSDTLAVGDFGLTMGNSFGLDCG